MKVLHKSKRSAAPHPQVADLISKLVNTPNDDLADVLQQIDTWKWPRSDLNAWIKVLDKFDAILADAIHDYDVDNLQLSPFTPLTKHTICEILRFERLLLENSTNRKIFSSYDRLNSFFMSSDMDVLILTLNLLLRPSQQYSAQPNVLGALNISTPRLQSLAKKWPALRDYNVGLADLASTSGTELVDALPSDAREVNFTFYNTSTTTQKEKSMDVDSTASQKTPIGGAVHIHIDEHTLASKQPMIILADLVEQYGIPENEKLELLCRIRVAQSLASGHLAERQQLVTVRLLALAIFGHTHTETQTASLLFLYEPDLISHVAEVLQIDRDIPIPVRTAAIAALDALARYRGRVMEVLTSVNAGVNHGLLMGLLRKTVTEISDPSSTLPHSFAEALLGFVTYIATHSAGGAMIVGAGLIPLLIQLIENKIPSRLLLVSKTMQLVDSVVYGFPNAFQLFCSARGVDALVQRIEEEVDLNIKEHGDSHKSKEAFGAFGQLPMTRAALLKHSLRSMHRMMQTSGTSEGLRGLIDSSLLKSVKKVIQHRGLFGPSVVPIAINIMATFVHNEPTSLAVIQEAGLPEVFYAAIENGLEPSIEVIQSIPNAIGALCLNQTGQDQLASRPSIIPGIFSIFTSEKHIKVLLDKDNAILIGATMDELIRHHPVIKDSVFEAIKSTLSKIETLGRTFEVPTNISHWYHLQPTTESAQEKDSAPMEGVETMGANTSDQPTQDASSGDESAPRSHDNYIIAFIDIICRFLEGLFQHIPHCRDFITTSDGLNRLGSLTSLPCLPYDFTNGPASDSLIQILRSMTEVAPKETVPHLLRIVKQSIINSKAYWSTIGGPSRFLPFIEFSEKDETVANQHFRSLLTLHIQSTLLYDSFANVSYSHGRASSQLLEILLGSSSEDVITELGALHRTSIWENVAFKAGLVEQGIDINEISPGSQATDAISREPGQSSTAGPQAEPSQATSQTESSGKDSVKSRNIQALQHLAHAIPASLSPLFLAIIKMFTTRRSPDANHRKQILSCAKIVAGIMLQHIQHVDIPNEVLAHTYYSVMLGAISVMIVEERSSSQTLYTIQLSAFYNEGGLDGIVNICRNFIATIERSTTKDDRTSQDKSLQVAYDGFKVALHLLHICVTARPLFEAVQTPILVQKNESEPDFFESHNFLVKTRLAVLPLVRDAWKADWLRSAPLDLVRIVVQIVLEICSADHEEAAPELPEGILMTALQSMTTHRTQPPDEGRITQLMEMGFPRSAVERALMRTGNNLAAATEFLLAQPWPIPDTASENVPPPVPSNGDSPTDQGENDDSESETSDAEMENAESAAEAPQPPSKSVADWKKELDEAREILRTDVDRQALRLVDEHPSLIFDLHMFFVRPSDEHQQRAVQGLVDDIMNFSPQAYGSHEQPLANRCRLLALVLSETPTAFPAELRKILMDRMLALLLSSPINHEEQPKLPKWLATHLLVVEHLLTLFDEPRTISVPKEGESVSIDPITVGPSYSESRMTLFDFCLRLLGISTLPPDELLSVLRMLVLLTRDYDKATEFVKRDGIPLLFHRLKISDLSGASCSSYVATILRHTAESKYNLQHLMQQGVKRYFTGSRNRPVDVANFVRGCSGMALRDPRSFLDVTATTCQLSSPDAPYQISLKPNPSSDASSKDESPGMQVDIPAEEAPRNSEHVESVVHFLVAELMSSVKAYIANDLESTKEGSATVPPEKSAEMSNNAQMPNSTSIPPSDQSPEQASHLSLRYCCFLMQCLMELLFSYDSCKVAFLTYSPKKRLQTPSKDTSKYRTTALNFLLSELISFQSLTHPTDQKIKGPLALCNWAMTTIAALCVDTSPMQDDKEISHDLQSVRRFVIEAVNRAMKETSPTDPIDKRYGRLLALSDLCYRILTAQINNQPRKPEDSPTQIAKIMLEKNIVSTLTTALADVDLNYPGVKDLVASILKPLEHLSRVAISMGRSSVKGKEGILPKIGEVELYSSESEEESEQEEREETPDLYRNSALGMYGGEMEDVHFSANDEIDEDEDMDEDDVEMEFVDDTGSEHTSESEEEDDEDEDGDEGESPLDDIPHVTSTWDEHDDEGEDDDDDDEDDELAAIDHIHVEDDDEDPGDDDDESDDDEGDGDMVWQDIGPDEVTPADVDEDGEEGATVQELAAAFSAGINRDEEDGEEPDAVSDEIIEYNDGDNLGNAIADAANQTAQIMSDIFGLNQAVGVGRIGGLLVPRRHRGGDEGSQIFGRHRNGAVAENVTHPLLIDSSTSPTRPLQGRSARTTPRTVNDGNDLIQVIEDVGGDASRLFHQIARSASRPIRVDHNGIANPDRAFFQHRGVGHILAAHLPLDRAPAPRINNTRPDQGLSFEPMLTQQRWAEESKILNGDFIADRVNKLTNFVIVTLLPAATEAAQAAKAKAEEERAKLEEEQRLKSEEEERIKREAEAAAAKEAAEASQVSATSTTSADPASESSADHLMSVVNQEADSEMADAANEVPEAASTEEPTQSAEAGPSSAAVQRVTVLIHGNPVDITDTGIDPTFLEALPDDMREEVLNQHVRDQRAASIQRPPNSQISSEFLDALPPEIRAEIIQQEQLEQSRQRANEETRNGQGTQGGPADIDPASFIASLDPHLREVVLMDSEEGFIQTLPPHMLAEATGYRENMLRRRAPRTNQRATPTQAGAPRSAAAQPKPSVQHDAIQLVDRAGVAVLVRLLFFPQVLKKTLLYKVLVNLCKNSKTRTEMFNLILSILQDGTGDLGAVDKSFAQMSFRNTKHPQTPKSKQKSTNEALAPLSLPHSQVEAVPDLIAQRCLEGLNFIVSALSETSILFFLTEHEVPPNMRKVVSKKGKGKEKQAPPTHYPIVLLLGLLDRQYLLKTPSIMESVVSLLATVTRPLASLKGAKPKDQPTSSTASQPGQSANAQPESQTAIAPEHAPETRTSAPSQAELVTDAVASPEAAAPEPVEDNQLLTNPPQIPHSTLRLIVNILTAGEVSGRSFQQTLTLIHHLSFIPDARDVIASELKTKAQEFGQVLYHDLIELASALHTAPDEALSGAVGAKFSPASSAQAKFLRVLKTIDYMYTPKQSAVSGSSEDADKVQEIYQSFQFAPLWRQLGDCLSLIEEAPDTEQLATVLLPLIESLMVVCKYAGTSPSNRSLLGAASPRSPTTPRESMEELFVTFTDAHRKVLNLMVRNNPSLMSGSFSLLVHNPRVLDFDNKRNYFNQQLHRRPHPREHHGTIQINVRRARLFEDSFQALQRKTGEQIKYGKLNVRFYDEEGVDAGGVTREWFQILARQMFDPNNALFQPCAADRLTYQPNKNSWVNPEHLSFFKFVGRVIGKAIYDGRLLDAYFARSLYRQILGKPVDYRDVEWVDPEYYNSLCWILENDPTVLELTFSVEADEFGVNRIIPLKEGGESITVTQENKREFVQLSAQYRLHSSIKDQIDSLLSGFYEIIPKDLVTIFNEQELELLISGTPDIDVDEWRAATEYHGYSSSDPAIVWWWRALKSFNRDERAKVLSFATGTSKVPLGGFVELQGVQGIQRFSIHKAYGETDRLPQAHTCFNQIDLPQYSSYENLRRYLLLAINEGGEGFGFA